MNYEKLYYNLTHQNKEYDCYTEKHHIVPICMNGSNDKNNLVTLSGREHFVAHWILTKIYPNKFELKYAFGMMCSLKDKRKLKSWEFQKAKENKPAPTIETRKKISKSLMGNIPWNKGIPRTEEEKMKMSQALKNRTEPYEGHRREVSMYDINGKFIRSFRSGAEAARFIGKPEGCGSHSIFDVCKGKQKTAYGYIWKR